MIVPTACESPDAFNAAIDSYPVAVPTISAAINSYVTDPATDRRNHDHGMPNTVTKLNSPTTMDREGTIEYNAEDIIAPFTLFMSKLISFACRQDLMRVKTEKIRTNPIPIETNMYIMGLFIISEKVIIYLLSFPYGFTCV